MFPLSTTSFRFYFSAGFVLFYPLPHAYYLLITPLPLSSHTSPVITKEKVLLLYVLSMFWLTWRQNHNGVP